jgi:hypothetical protein
VIGSTRHAPLARLAKTENRKMSPLSDGAVAKRINVKLQRLVDTYPMRATEVGAILLNSGLKPATIEQLLVLKLGRAANDLSDVAVFQAGTRRPLSPMLTARFSFAGAIHDLSGHMLSISDIDQILGKKRLKAVVDSHRQHWEGSAPATVPPDRLSVFSISNLDDDDLTYLVWANQRSHEPQLWSYSGQHESRYKNLETYLEYLCA